MKARSVKTSFQSAGVRCAATLHLPEGAGPFPAILMVHGWGGVQDALTLPFYAPFKAAGFAVMTFDYVGWGQSEGTPRNVIDPHHRERDAESALQHLREQAGIDPRRIALWGTSFGGGHVVRLAARHPELLGAIAQVPMLDGMAAVKAVPAMRLARFGWSGLRDLLRGKDPIYLPVVAGEGEWSSMDRDGAALAMQKGLQAMADTLGDQAPPYDNRVAARSLLTMGGLPSLQEPQERCDPAADRRRDARHRGAIRGGAHPGIEQPAHPDRNPRRQPLRPVLRARALPESRLSTRLPEKPVDGDALSR